MGRIYLDYHSTTPLDPRVYAAMEPYFKQRFGNAASGDHAFGWEAEEAVDKARHQVAQLVGAESRDVVFTSGATEANDLALAGTFEAPGRRGNHLVISAVEHKSVLDTAAYLERRGATVTRLPVDQEGRVRAQDVAAAITPQTWLVSIMAANNEIGTIQPTSDIAAICRDKEILFHTDAAQAAGKIPFAADGLDFVSISGHKICGPKGVGALIIDRNARQSLVARVHGGGQEDGLRSGTANVPGIVGFGHACKLAMEEGAANASRIGALRDRLLAALQGGLTDIVLNGPELDRLPGNLHLSFRYVEAESLALSLEDVAVSTGSACTSADNEPSHVLTAIGRTDELLHGGIRFGLGRFTTEAEIDEAAGRVVAAVQRLRSLSPLWAQREQGPKSP
jgi:cysteine desulfurase